MIPPKPKKAQEASKPKRDLTSVLRDMGLRFSSDSDVSEEEEEEEDLDEEEFYDEDDDSYEPTSPKKISEGSFFSSLRDLLK